MNGQSFSLSSCFSKEKLLFSFYDLYRCRYSYSPHRRKDLERYYKRIDSDIDQLHTRLLSGTYEPTYTGCVIDQKKKDGTIKYRGIVLSNVEDTIVQRCLISPLTKILQQKVATECSYGRSRLLGEKSRSPIQCGRDINFARKTHPFGFETDLINFFPSIRRDTLLPIIRSGIDYIEGFEELYDILSRIITRKVLYPSKASPEQRETFWPEFGGVHQGTVLAPLLANLYLSDFDRAISAKFRLFRYIDDIAC